MASKKVIYVIVEGGTDETSLNRILKKINNEKLIKFIVIQGDITSQNGTEPSNVKIKLNSFVKRDMGIYSFKKSDILQIIHVIDTDGVFVDNNRIQYKDTDNVEYTTENIYTKNVDDIIKRNEMKAAVLNKLISTEDISGIPYSVYYFSSNLEHVLHNVQNATREEKEKLAIRFDKKYENNPEELMNFICKSDFSVGDEYKKSWDFIKSNNNSLKRYSNIALLLKNEWNI